MASTQSKSILYTRLFTMEYNNKGIRKLKKNIKKIYFYSYIVKDNWIKHIKVRIFQSQTRRTQTQYHW